ncbi:hypothetical protein GCM10009679_52740 [Saccharothrix algeriensis]|uniref:DUF4240 domain-containing protein n=1 Tax=Catellatospora bangladeshensis TaxID=310355 RepID=A0A8J3JM79_9ACTN|nr:hypothetical protein Cba03nite_18580 [Catellatospora bangladeshensis]
MSAVDEAGFWDVIDESYAALECGYYDEDSPAAAVAVAWREGLAGRPLPELVEFGVHFERMLERAWTPAVWAAACLLAGGGADEWHAHFDLDDRFADFRASLVALGRESFEVVLADPDALAGLPDADAVERGDWDFFMRLRSAPAEIHARAGGDRDGFARAVAQRLGGRPRRGGPGQDGPWQIDEHSLPGRLPRLAARFPESAL